MRCGENDPERPYLLRCLADALAALFQGAGFNDMELADEALGLRKTALSLTPPDDPMIHQYKYDLASSLSDNFDDTGVVEHLSCAVSLLRDVIESRASDGLPARFDLLLQYALRTQILFKVTRRKEDIDACLAAFVEYADAIPDDHRTRKLVRCFCMTAAAMLDRHAQFPSSDTLNEAFALFEKSTKVPAATSFDVYQASLVWAQAAQQCNHLSEIEAYKRAFTLYSQFIWFGYGLRIRYSRIQSSDHLRLPARAADCAIRFNRLEQAVEWLDEGRSMLWGQMSNLRSSLNSLRSLDADLANRFEIAGRELEELADIDEVPSRPGTTQPYSRLDVSDISESKVLRMAEWNSILDKIRAIPQFSTYLKPRSYSELREISYRGPVFIINLAETHSNALILPSPHEPIIHIVLPEMTLGRALHLKKRLSEALRGSGRQVRDNRHVRKYKPADGNESLRSILAELWAKIAEPILSRAGLTVSYQLKLFSSCIERLISHYRTCRVTHPCLEFGGVLPVL
jgi:tetratricopeptide (TPR) repeat protein